MRDLTSGQWFDIKTATEFEQIRAYGRLEHSRYHARVQRGTWQGKGKYKLFQYTQRCPRNCCDDDVNELLPEKEVQALVNEHIQELIGYDAFVFYSNCEELEQIDDMGYNPDGEDLTREEVIRKALWFYYENLHNRGG